MREPLVFSMQHSLLQAFFRSYPSGWEFGAIRAHLSRATGEHPEPETRRSTRICPPHDSVSDAPRSFRIAVPSFPAYLPRSLSP